MVEKIIVLALFSFVVIVGVRGLGESSGQKLSAQGKCIDSIESAQPCGAGEASSGNTPGLSNTSATTPDKPPASLAPRNTNAPSSMPPSSQARSRQAQPRQAQPRHKPKSLNLRRQAAPKAASPKANPNELTPSDIATINTVLTPPHSTIPTSNPTPQITLHQPVNTSALAIKAVKQSKNNGYFPSKFNKNNVVSDAFYTLSSITEKEIQAMLEKKNSWLAKYKINKEPLSRLIVRQAKDKKINPILLLARLQIEKSAVSKKVSKRKMDYIMGCGCYTGKKCMKKYKGFENQMSCAATVLAKHYYTPSSWKAGKQKTVNDGLGKKKILKKVKPVNQATAALYAYTPHVTAGGGGNKLVWQVLKNYARTMGYR